MTDNSICIIDFAGNHKYGGFWADYFPQEKKVKFGGEWYDIPDMEVDHRPSEKECLLHINLINQGSKSKE